MTKPFSPSVLADTVDRVAEMSQDELQRHRAQQVAGGES
jgi:hypothetical protein